MDKGREREGRGRDEWKVQDLIHSWLSRSKTARGLVPVVRLGVPLGYKAWKLCYPLSFPLGNERTLV